MLRAGVLDKPCRGLDRRYSRLHGQDELLELRKEMRCPSIGRVDDRPRSDNSSVSVDCDPAIAVSLRHTHHWCVGLQVQIAFLMNDT